MEVRRGGCRAHVELPAEGKGGRGVLILHEAFGVNEDMRRIARRFAGEGYVAVLPALFGGPRCLARTLREEARTQELDGWREWMRDEHGVEHAGIIGFCMGGGFALGHAATGADFDAVSVNYGMVPEGDLSRVCPVVGSYGELDRMFVPQAAKLVELLEKAGVEHDVKVYPEAGHSFLSQHGGWQKAMERLPGPMALGYRPEAAEDAWARIFAFFEKHVA
jgi:carboxymethylenebutenolidase